MSRLFGIGTFAVRATANTLAEMEHGGG